jgi:hypothetical protein
MRSGWTKPSTLGDAATLYHSKWHALPTEQTLAWCSCTGRIPIFCVEHQLFICKIPGPVQMFVPKPFLTRWLSTNCVCRLLPMLLTALGDPVSAPAAAIAIRDLCDCCGRHMGTPHILEQLMGLYQKTLEAGAATKTAAAAAAAAAASGAQGVIAGPVMTAAQRSAAAGAAVAAAGNAVAASGALHEDDVHCVIQGMVMCLSRCVRFWHHIRVWGLQLLGFCAVAVAVVQFLPHILWVQAKRAMLQENLPCSGVWLTHMCACVHVCLQVPARATAAYRPHHPRPAAAAAGSICHAAVHTEPWGRRDSAGCAPAAV